MKQVTLTLLCLLITFLPSASRGQSSNPSPKLSTKTTPVPANPQKPRLTAVQTIESPSDTADDFQDPLTCDGQGNVYLESDRSGVFAIRKFSPQGKRLAIFQPGSARDMTLDVAGNFSVTQTGELYQLAFPHELDRYVFVYSEDGSYKARIKLQPGFPWMPSTLAALPSGKLLVVGQEWDRSSHTMWPFTGLFSGDGLLLKEVKLEDDDSLHDMAAVGDSRVTSPIIPGANRAVAFSQMQVAQDGNVYLMRWINPAVFYAISPDGEVVRRFEVDPGEPAYRPSAMHVSGNRIAVMFYQPQTTEKVMKVVDLEGQEQGTYDVTDKEGAPDSTFLGLAFACYSAKPERFIFLAPTERNAIAFRTAESR